MSSLVVVPVVLALAVAVLTLLVRPWPRVTRAVSLAGAVGYAGACFALFSRVVLGETGPVPYYLGNWPAPFGITLVADALSAGMLALAAVVVVPVVVFAVVYVDSDGQTLSFHPLTHFMLAGVSGSFLTGDLFNLFVWFEVMLMASYVLVLFYSGPDQTEAGIVYVVLNLFGSAVMLVAIGGLYATVGTLNMADMIRRLSQPAAFDVALAPTLGLAALLGSVFLLKAGLVPFHFWVPGAYAAAPIPVTALLAGVVKKVGVYAVLRLFYTVIAVADYQVASGLGYIGPILLVMATASVLYGGAAAVGRGDLRELLALSSVAQIGFVFLPVGVAMTLGSIPGGETLPGGSLATLAITAALVYSFNHTLAKSGLFLVAGTLTSAVGTVQLDQLGGLARRTPLAATAFLVAGLSLIGVPPVIGFFGKLLVFRVGVVAGAASSGLATAVGWGSVAVALVGAVLTIAYVTRAWGAVFWGEPSQTVAAVFEREAAGQRRADPSEAAAPDGGPRFVRRPALVVEVTACVVLAAAIVGFGLGAEFVIDAAVSAAEATVDSEAYREAVLPAGGDG